jgi:hypothetical protein
MDCITLKMQDSFKGCSGSDFQRLFRAVNSGMDSNYRVQVDL